jgi:phospholipid transport system substrate-binding protein
MNHYFKRLVSPLLVLIVTLAVQFAFAAGAQSYLEAKQKELTALIVKPKTPASDKQLQTTFDALLDYDALAKDSLGKEWDARSEAERKEFQALLTTLVQSAYTKNIRNTLDYNITFTGSQPAKTGGELILTVAKHKTDPRKESIRIDYLVHDVSGKWRVYDIITEGSSLVKNYNNQFRRIISKSGFADLIARMKKKAAEES